MKRLFIPILFLACLLNSPSSIGQTQFVGMFDSGLGFGAGIQQTADSGFVFAGTGSINPIWNWHLSKTDNNGNLLWSKSYGGANQDECQDIEITADGGFILAGRVKSYGEPNGDAALMKTDAAGNVQWLKTYGGTSSYDQFAGVKEFPTGGFVAVGQTASYGGNIFNAYAVRTNSLGDTLWTYVFKPSASLFSLSTFSNVVINDNGDITIAGQTAATGTQTVLIKLDSLGNEIWKYIYSGIGSIPASDIDFSTNKQAYYIAAANGGGDAVMLKIDTAGTLLWSKRYNVSPAADRINFIHALPNDGGILGTYRQDLNSWILKLDTAGNLIWANKYRTCNNAYAFGVIDTYDNGIAMIENDLGMNATALIKTDNVGNSSFTCLDSTLIPVINPITMTRSTFGTRLYGAIVGSPSPPVTVLTPKNEFYSCNPDTADFSWLSYTQCTFDSTVFTSIYTTNSGFPVSFLWNFGDGNTSTLENPNHLYGAGGTFTVLLTINWGCTTDTISYPITIATGSPPTATFTQPPPDTVCVGTFLVVIAAGGNNTFYWGDGFMQGPGGFSVHTYNVPGNYTFVLVRQNNCGIDSLTQSVVVTGPTPSFTFAPTTFCLGQATNFTDTSIPGIAGPITSWAWNFGDGLTDNVQNPSHVYSMPGTYPINLIVTDQNGCSNFVWDTIAIVADTNIAAISWSAGCPCNDITFNSTGTAASWLWNFGDGTTSSAQNPIHNYALPGSYTVSLIGTNLSGCAINRYQNIITCPGDTLWTSKSNINSRFYNNAGLDFNAGTPTYVGSILSTPPYTAPEGCATVSDPLTGNILFYTNGDDVVDITNNIMPNGSTIGGPNTPSSASQSSVIVPYPGNKDRYYIFSNDGYTGGGISIRYSVVDMTLNGGLGNVVAGMKGILLTTTQGSESMSATIKYNGTCAVDDEYWLVIPLDYIQYEVFLIDNSGITSSSIQNFPTINGIPAIQEIRFNQFGQSQFSHNGSRYVKSHGIMGFYLYDFDRTTGILSNQVFFPRLQPLIGGSYFEFSPNDRYLYVNSNNVTTFATAQFDLYANDIFGSRTILYSGNTRVSELWLADDGKIYCVNQTNSLSVINNPNVAGVASNFNLTGYNLPAGINSGLGIQNLVNLNVSVQDTSFASFTSSINCLSVNFTNTSDTLNYTDPCSYLANNDTLLNYYWDFGDGSTSTQYQPSYTYALNGTYTVQLVVERPFMCTTDTITQSITVAQCCISTSQFVKTYGEGEANWVIQTSDCGFMIAGLTRNSGAGGSDGYLIRTDANGNQLWSQTYGGASNDVFETVEETSDGGFIALGQALSFGAGQGDMYLVKTDNLGNLQWSKTYGGTEWDWGVQVKQLPDDGYILTGQTFSYEQVTAPITFFDGYVIRTNSLGDTLWTTTLHANNSNFGNSIMGVEINTTGNFLVGGVTVTTNHQSWLVELDGATGAIIWSKDYDIGAYSESYFPHQLPNGNYAYAGFTQNSVFGGTDFILKQTDNTGNIQWAKVYGGAAGDAARDMELTSDGGFIMAGQTGSYGFGGQDFMLLKLDATGTPEWTKTYGGCNDETRASVVQTTDNGYAMVGSTQSLGNMANAKNIILIKTDSLGNSGLTCFETNPTPLVQNVNLTVNTGAVQINAGIVTTINAPGIAALIDTITPNCIFTANFVADSVCFNNVTTFTDSSSMNINPCSWSWNFGNPASGVNDTSTLQNPTHLFTSAGTFNVTLTTSWMGAVDSITISVVVYQVYTVPQAQTICIGDSIFLEGAYQNTAGIYTDSLLTINGCDSIITTTLSVDAVVINNLTTTICNGDSLFVGGAFQNSTGIYIDSLTTTAGCDSIITTNLTVNPTYLVPQTMSICQGDSALIGSIYYNISGIYDDSLTTALGCDSIIQVTLTVNPLPTSATNISICQGDSILLGGSFQFVAGVFNDTIFSGGFNGCDSLITTTLTINSLPTSNTTASICQGDSILLGGSFQFTAGVFNDTIFGGGFNSCDSLIATTLTINSLPTSNATDAICQGDSILIGGSYYFTAGVFNDTIFNGSFTGCDSIISTTLSVSPLGDATITPVNTLCSGDATIVIAAAQSGGVWSGNGITNTSTGIFDPNIAGLGSHQIIYTIAGTCGDADTINILVNPSPTVIINTIDDNCEESIGEIDVALLTGIPPITYNWNNGATTSNLANLSAGIYTLIIADSTGCTSTEQISISDLAVDCQFHIYLPNVFSPNDDGENDVLFVRGKGVEQLSMIIYNRWGNKVFETNDMSFGWDGTFRGNKLNSAVFVYYINATFTNGQTVTDKGNVSIVK